jgi:hypothetical protein
MIAQPLHRRNGLCTEDGADESRSSECGAIGRTWRAAIAIAQGEATDRRFVSSDDPRSDRCAAMK